MYPPVGLLSVTQQQEVERVYGPADTRVKLVPFHLLHPEHWSNPLVFTPERWLSNETDAGINFVIAILCGC
jgi:cytochrome P450